MKSLLLIAAALILSTFTAPQAKADACTTAALSVYDAPGFGCTIGSGTFSDFTYVTSGTPANQIPDIAVTMTPIKGGLQFNAPWSAVAGTTTDATISFDVTAKSGASLLQDVSLAQVGGAVGNGSASVAEFA
jgi:hypothetical protein